MTEKNLEQLVSYFSEQSISPATRLAYASDWRQFCLFCGNNGLDFLPATPETVCLYLAHLTTDRAISTIVRSITSIGHAHEQAGFDSPTKTNQVYDVLHGIKRTCGSPVNSRSPLSYSDLKKMMDCCGSSFIGIRDRSILSLGWASALRRSELKNLNVSDLEFVEQGMIITIRRSKTDQDGQGRFIGIPRSGDKFCPVHACEVWLRRQNDKIPSGDSPLYSSIGPHGVGRWFYTTGGRLSDRMISLTVKKYAKLAGLPSTKYSAHSLRRGLATEAGSRGVPERIIAAHTGHRSMTVLRGYIERGSIWEENPLRVIYERPDSTSIPFSDTN